MENDFTSTGSWKIVINEKGDWVVESVEETQSVVAHTREKSEHQKSEYQDRSTSTS